MNTRRLVVGISGSSGVIIGIRLLQVLRASTVEAHLVLTPAARVTIEQETSWKVKDVEALAGVTYSNQDIGAAIASGSFHTDGMAIVPCSIKTLSAVANCYAADLISRAADVTLKEGRPLLLAVRETPLHRGHIRLMDQAAASGAVIFPPVPAFYTGPQNVDDIVDNLVGRILARLGIENDIYQTWTGLKTRSETVDAQSEILTQAEMTLATTDESGQPHAAAVYFAADDAGRLYFFSDPNTAHARNLARSPRAAATIQPRERDWRAIRGLQLHGEVLPVAPGADWERAFELYVAKFPFVSELKDALKQNTLYVLLPDWVRLVDNRRGFGFKEERGSL